MIINLTINQVTTKLFEQQLIDYWLNYQSKFTDYQCNYQEKNLNVNLLITNLITDEVIDYLPMWLDQSISTATN